MIVACPAFNRKPASETFQGIRIIRRNPIPFYKKFRAAALTLPFFYFYWKKFVRKLFRENTFDVIHAHDLIQGSTAVWASNRYNIPFVIDFHENYPYMLEEEPFSKGLLGKMLIPISLWKAYEKRVMSRTKYFISVAKEI
ncbi:MAG: glycosyltransferase [Haliscomenobacter sp.]|nr:glycosyltransferase [Haliscomenobacter sp.]